MNHYPGDGGDEEKRAQPIDHRDAALAQDVLCQRISRQLSSFPGYAQVRRVAVIDEPWTVDNEMITPTLKLRRNRILECHQAAVDALYAGH